jgi:hypothetical protein
VTLSVAEDAPRGRQHARRPKCLSPRVLFKLDVGTAERVAGWTRATETATVGLASEVIGRFATTVARRSAGASGERRDRAALHRWPHHQRVVPKSRCRQNSKDPTCHCINEKIFAMRLVCVSEIRRMRPELACISGSSRRWTLDADINRTRGHAHRTLARGTARDPALLKAMGDSGDARRRGSLCAQHDRRSSPKWLAHGTRTPTRVSCAVLIDGGVLTPPFPQLGSPRRQRRSASVRCQRVPLSGIDMLAGPRLDPTRPKGDC